MSWLPQITELIKDPHFKIDAFRLFLVIASFGIIFIIDEIWRILANPPVEWTRKFVHMSCGIIIACFQWIFISAWPVYLFGLLIISVMIASRIFHWFQFIYGIQRKSLGDIYYLISVVMLFPLSYDHPTFYFISILTLTVSDALAAIFGTIYHKITYTVEQSQKSLEGSAVFFLSTFLIVQIPLLLNTDLDRLECILIALQISLIITCLEAICLEGIDNLLIPFGTFYLLFKLQELSTHQLFWLILSQVILIIFINIISWKFKFLTASGAIAAQLFFFGTLSLGEPTWLIVPLLALAIFTLIFAIIQYEMNIAARQIYQVIAVFYITIIPALIYIIHDIFQNYPEKVPEALSNVNSFFPVFTGVVNAHLAIAIYRLFWLYTSKSSAKELAYITLSTFAIVVPFGLWFQLDYVSLKDLSTTLLITIVSSLIFYLLSTRWKKANIFPWEFRVQTISVLIATLLAMPLYLIQVLENSR